jgi:antitoxin (DNA-binding transcriptional repressor) of toxin-antitoxin stability system
MQTITLQEAQSHLTEIIEKLPPGEAIVITRDDKPVATLRAMTPPMPRPQRQLGTFRSSVLYMAPDFDTIPEGHAGREPQIGVEEIEQCLRRGGGRSLAEILADLEKK